MVISSHHTLQALLLAVCGETKPLVSTSSSSGACSAGQGPPAQRKSSPAEACSRGASKHSLVHRHRIALPTSSINSDFGAAADRPPPGRKTRICRDASVQPKSTLEPMKQYALEAAASGNPWVKLKRSSPQTRPATSLASDKFVAPHIAYPPPTLCHEIHGRAVNMVFGPV